MTTFLTNRQPVIAHITAHRHDSATHGLHAIVDFEDDQHYTMATLQIDEVAIAREHLAAAFEAVKILDPDGAPDALMALIEGDALAKILARANEQEVREALAYRAATSRGGGTSTVTLPGATAINAVPDTAKPVDVGWRDEVTGLISGPLPQAGAR